MFKRDSINDNNVEEGSLDLKFWMIEGITCCD